MQRQAMPRRGIFAFASVLLVALALQIQGAFAQAIPSSAKYSCDFENGYCDFVEQSALGDAPPSARRSTLVSTTRGSRGVRLHTEPGDANVHGSGNWERNDILKPADSSYCNEGQEEWWAVSVMFPSDYVFPPGPEAGIILDFHHNGSGGQANYEIQTIPNIGLRARGYGGASRDEGKFDALIPDPYGAVNNVTRNVWYDFVFHVRWSSNANGVMEGWVNGVKFQSYHGATLYAGMSCYLKLANYHAPFGQPSSIIYDRIVRGTSAADVAITELGTVIGAAAPTTPSVPTTPATVTSYTLSSSISGTGSGTVTSSPSGVVCSSSCATSFSAGSIVTLTASAASGSTFTGWSGACSGTGQCSLSMGNNQSVTATFASQTVSTPAGGTGSLSVSGGIDATAYTIGAGQSVTFTAKVSGTSGTPTGTLAFRDNGAVISGCAAVALSGGSATCTTSFAVGSHAITGAYSGNSTYGVGVMGPVTITAEPGSSPAATPVAASAYNVQGLWWNAAESGWGVNLDQQGDILFATWYTYDTQGRGLWLVMSNGDRVADNAYSGKLYTTTGPAYDAPSYNAANVRYAEVGTAYFSFSDADSGTIVATINGATVTKSISRYVYANPRPSCSYGASANGNYQGLWWRTGGSESGWGVNLTHQGDVLFATLYTYDESGNPMWLSGSALTRTGNGTYSGSVERTTGPAYNVAFDPSRVVRVPVGTMAITFSADGVNATLSFSVNGVTVTKPITRFVYATPTTACQ